MNKTEIAEIKKQFTPDKCTIERICTCYVGTEKEKKIVSRDSFLSLPEEEMHKYLAFFKKILTGSIGKTIMPLEFPLAEEAAGGRQEFLMRLRESALTDEDILDEFYNKIINNYDNPAKYCILTVYASYDIPGKASDELEMDDASDYVYNYILCCICPVELSKGELGVDVEKNRIGELKQEWVVKAPDKGFLFPAFTDRQTDIHEVLYYSRKSEEIMEDFIAEVFGAEAPLSAGTQKESFQTIVSDTMGDEGDIEIMKNIQESIAGIVEENRENPEPVKLKAPELKKILAESGASAEKLEHFDEHFENLAGDDAEIIISNIQEKKFSVKTPDVEIHVSPEYLNRLEARVIDGKKCLVIEVDDNVEVNGVPVKTIANRMGGEF